MAGNIVIYSEIQLIAMRIDNDSDHTTINEESKEIDIVYVKFV